MDFVDEVWGCVKLNELGCCFYRLIKNSPPTPARKPTQVTTRFQEVCELRRRSLLTAGRRAPAVQPNTTLCISPKDNYKIWILRSRVESVTKSYKCRTKGQMYSGRSAGHEEILPSGYTAPLIHTILLILNLGTRRRTVVTLWPLCLPEDGPQSSFHRKIQEG
jgi:hypothetical protein